MNSGWRYSRSASTIIAPYLSTWSNMSRWPPENPRQLAKIISGSSSPWLKSLIACAVLNAESGNQTCPACCSTCCCDSALAGSAGITASIVRVSTAITPIGTPPSRARPVTTVLAHPPSVSTNESRSNRPLTHRPPFSSSWPAIRHRGSYGSLCGNHPTSRSTGSTAGTIGSGMPRSRGMKASHSRIALTPWKSSLAVRCDTPLLYMICVPPSCRLDVYTSRPRTLLSAPAPVRMIGLPSFWIARWPRRTRYAPMPTERHVTSVTVKFSLYARDVSPAIRPEPCKFSTPMPSTAPITSVIM
eukprot:Unigene5881_Nuclearia_a/m.17975 Unigene5881_Nuclearia_a/g.17975  ORF Unigene5881_Nuclearia_a/g.17975 Unigene5881_Nuclearia_a/m.17975 type:complete len:301 (+) Unigene5881_Nuclearia_a:796-1698(+)